MCAIMLHNTHEHIYIKLNKLYISRFANIANIGFGFIKEWVMQIRAGELKMFGLSKMITERNFIHTFYSRIAIEKIFITIMKQEGLKKITPVLIYPNVSRLSCYVWLSY